MRGKAYDSVPHDLLLYRLLNKGVCGKAFRAVDRMYAAANSFVKVVGCKSAPFPVRRSVAQGCPLCPFRYAVYIDSVLDDLYTVAPQRAFRVGDADWLRPWQGQLAVCGRPRCNSCGHRRPAAVY